MYSPISVLRSIINMVGNCFPQAGPKCLKTIIAHSIRLVYCWAGQVLYNYIAIIIVVGQSGGGVHMLLHLPADLCAIATSHNHDNK